VQVACNPLIEDYTETPLQLSENITLFAVCHIYTGVISKET
jgi:hypothetical protein